MSAETIDQAVDRVCNAILSTLEASSLTTPEFAEELSMDYYHRRKSTFGRQLRSRLGHALEPHMSSPNLACLLDLLVQIQRCAIARQHSAVHFTHAHLLECLTLAKSLMVEAGKPVEFHERTLVVCLSVVLEYMKREYTPHTSGDELAYIDSHKTITKLVGLFQVIPDDHVVLDFLQRALAHQDYPVYIAFATTFNLFHRVDVPGTLESILKVVKRDKEITARDFLRAFWDGYPHCTQEEQDARSAIAKRCVQLLVDYRVPELAYGLAMKFALSNEFPDVVKEHQQTVVRSMLKKKKVFPLTSMLEKYNNPDTVAYAVDVCFEQQEYLTAREIVDTLKMLSNGAVLVSQVDHARFEEFKEQIEQVRNTARAEMLQIPADTAIHFVDNSETLGQMKQALETWMADSLDNDPALHPHFTLGLDAEWKPTMKKNQVARASIVQLASLDFVYVVDLLTLCRGASREENQETEDTAAATKSATKVPPKPENQCRPTVGVRADDGVFMKPSSQPQPTCQLPTATSNNSDSATPPTDPTSAASPSWKLLDELMQSVLTCPTVVKIGFGWSNDLQILKASYPRMSCWDTTNPGLDLSLNSFAQTCNKLKHNTNVQDMFAARPLRGKSLRDLAHTFLGKTMSKTYQMSNWELRPLLEDQLHYAALDSYALAKIVQLAVPVGDTVATSAVSELLFAIVHNQSKRSLGGKKAKKSKRKANNDVLVPPLSNVQVEETIHSFLKAHEGVESDVADSTRGASNDHVSDNNDVAVGAPFDASKRMCVFELPNTTRTVQEAATELRCNLEQVIKTLAFFYDSHAVHQTGARGSLALATRDACSTPSDMRWRPIIVLVPGDAQVDSVKLSQFCSSIFCDSPSTFIARAKEVKMATLAECVNVFGFVPGSMSPFGTRLIGDAEIPVVMDEAVNRVQGNLFMGGGTLNHTLMVRDSKTLRAGLAARCFTGDITSNGLASVPSSSVLPKTRSFETILLNPDEELKFYVDDGLGKIKKWLRVYGYHAESLSDHHKSVEGESRSQMVRKMLHYASTNDLIMLSSDRKIGGYKTSCRIYVVNSLRNSQTQFKEVCGVFGIEYDAGKFLTRCTKCNSPGFDIISSEEAIKLLKEQSFDFKFVASHSEYYVCRNKDCAQIYWEGHKYFDAKDKYRHFLE